MRCYKSQLGSLYLMSTNCLSMLFKAIDCKSSFFTSIREVLKKSVKNFTHPPPPHPPVKNFARNRDTLIFHLKTSVS